MEEELYTRIEDYLDNTLNAAERAAFEADVQANPALAETLAEVREARSRLAGQWMHEDADRALTGTLQQIGRAHFKGHAAADPAMTVVLRARPRRWWPLVAAAACLIAVLIWFFRPAGETTLYAQYRQFPAAAFGTRSTENPTQADLAAADAAFNAGHYADALPLLQRYLATHPEDLEKRFFAALCQLELGQTTEAASAFQQLRIAPAYADEATWYLALTYLKEKNEAQCAEVLRQITRDARHYDAAQQLLEKLDVGQ